MKFIHFANTYSLMLVLLLLVENVQSGSKMERGKIKTVSKKH